MAMTSKPYKKSQGNHQTIMETITDEIIKINPYNLNNRFITREEVNTILTNNEITLPVTKIAYYQQAFVHKSYCRKKDSENLEQNIELAEQPPGSLDLQEESNERLEFLGDAVVNFVVGKYLYERFEDQDEGFLTRIRTKLVNGETLASFAQQLGFSRHLIISRHVEDRCNGRKNLRILEDTFESFIGAMFLDFNQLEITNHQKNPSHTKSSLSLSLELFSGIGFQVCENFIIQILESCVDFTELILKDHNYKDQLLRHYQQQFQDTPRYQEVSIDGPPHNRIFTMSVTDNHNVVIGIGRARSKKKAEQLASQKALIHLGVIAENTDQLE